MQLYDMEKFWYYALSESVYNGLQALHFLISGCLIPFFFCKQITFLLFHVHSAIMKKDYYFQRRGIFMPKKRSSTKSRIIKAAWNLFYKHGY